MHPWLHDYNTRRAQSALKGKPPLRRIGQAKVLENDI